MNSNCYRVNYARRRSQPRIIRLWATILANLEHVDSSTCGHGGDEVFGQVMKPMFNTPTWRRNDEKRD